ncbi:hypothetical protein CQW23_21873 [Capsicum baccatum]|uniref:Uncharacterized protein n=1 Tax=Capsicum baccatum TaxID=33114 RepID=A0A2G2VZ88_CAPBA|nr:hypothetical protein CQW23_21873 [Capsicum baccatum]
MGIRCDLWVDENDECKLAAFAIPKNKKVAFLKTLKNISVPDGYSNMPRFKRMQNKQKLGSSVSTSQGTESAPSFLDKINLSPLIQHAPQPSRPVYSASHPAPIDEDTLHPGPTVFPESQPSPTDHLTSYPSLVGRDSSQPSPVDRDSSHLSPIAWDLSQPFPVGRDSSQPSLVGWNSSQPSPVGRDSSYPYPDSSQSSRSVHSTSHSTPTNQDSSQSASTDEAAPQKRSRRESNTHWVVDAIDSRNNVKKIKVKVKEVLNLTGEHIMPSDAASGPISSMDARRSQDDNDPNDIL